MEAPRLRPEVDTNFTNFHGIYLNEVHPGQVDEQSLIPAAAERAVHHSQGLRFSIRERTQDTFGLAERSANHARRSPALDDFADEPGLMVLAHHESAD